MHLNLPVQKKALLHKLCLAPVLDCRCESSSLSPYFRSVQTFHRIICHFKQCQMKFRGWGLSWRCDVWTSSFFLFQNLHLLPNQNPVFSSMKVWAGFPQPLTLAINAIAEPSTSVGWVSPSFLTKAGFRSTAVTPRSRCAAKVVKENSCYEWYCIRSCLSKLLN